MLLIHDKTCKPCFVYFSSLPNCPLCYVTSWFKYVDKTCEPLFAEYSYTRKVNRKTDVYSFGVVLLELTTRREAVTYGDHMNLAQRAHLQSRDTNAIIDALDDEIKDSTYLNQIITVFRLGVVCTAESPSNRPSMKDCLHILQST